MATPDSKAANSILVTMATMAWRIMGLCLCLGAGVYFAWSTNETHEATMYFTSIKQVEREISLRTEQGLYYSYYKQMVNADDAFDALLALINDNVTEHPDTINVLQRMNVYQEVLLALVYRFTWLGSALEPIYLYIYSVLLLNCFLVCGIAGIAWRLTGSPLAGCLAAVMYGINGSHTTRLSATHALREHFALPFMWLQILCLTVYFARDEAKSKLEMKLAPPMSFICTLLFALFWQFNQFVLLLQSLSVLTATIIGFLPFRKAFAFFSSVSISILTVSLLQFANPMLLTSPALSLCLGSSVALLATRGILGRFADSPVGRLFCLCCRAWCCLLLSALCHAALKLTIQHEADNHVYKFVMMKLGYGYDDDFDVRMYNCAGAFVWLPWSTFDELSSTWLLQPYLVSHCALFLLTFFGFFAFLRRGWSSSSSSSSGSTAAGELLERFASRPEFAFHAVQSTVFGLLGYTTLRMKYFWTPYMCSLMTLPLGSAEVWARLLRPLRLGRLPALCWSQGITLALLATTAVHWHRANQSSWRDLREFWDPDTVELMEWIQRSTPIDAAFTGSMQLLAGVKCCTGRRITNHPHYEDRRLRDKTRQLYQIYGRKSPDEIYKLLKSYKTHYIILEDSICLRPNNGCGTTELMDNFNGELTDSQLLLPHSSRPPHLKVSRAPRFCDEIRRWHGRNDSQYGRLFKLVLANRTFRVYKLA